MRHSLKYRVAIATALVVTFIILARALFAQFYAYQGLKALRQAQQETLVKLIAEQLDEKFETRAIALRRLAHQLAPMLGQPPADMRRFAAQAVSMPEIFNAVFLALPNGDMVFSTAVPIGQRIHLADRDYFREIVNGSEFAVSDLLRGRMSDSPGAVLAVPLRGPDGKLLAVVGGALNFSESNFLGRLAHSRIGLTGSYCLVSSGTNPRYAMHPDPAKVMAPAKALGEACGLETPPSQWEIVNPTQPIVARYLLESNGWEVVSVLPAKEAFAPLMEARRKTIMAAGMSLLLAALLMWLVIRRMLAPLELLHRVVGEVPKDPAALDALAALPTGRNDEIGELATTFGAVMHQLSEREAALSAAKDRAAESEKRIEAIANHVPDFVSFIDMGERYVFVNEAYAQRFGLPVRQIVGLTVRELWGTPAYVASKPYLEQAYLGASVTFSLEGKDGAECMEVTYQPAWNDDRDTVQGLYMFARNVTSERQKMRSLEAQTLTDHLTGLLNRKGFDRRMADAMARAGANHASAALLLVDVDDFKTINDTFGHAVGDHLLAAFGERLSACVRTGDAVARIGGDEFGIVLDDALNIATLERIAQAIVHAARQAHFIEGHTIVATASVGMAIHYPDDGQTVNELFMRADMALYEAKRSGKARYTPPPASSSRT
ncbi:diguanylate cyclase domain-containing protein [Cupriavidus sp. CuC1]|uniref:sensor domain-containing diguanylate cyclase n=1 Tax=Cupriavidus sp. CuC1 TaxID=3373131 RepID=UPI0037D97180